MSRLKRIARRAYIYHETPLVALWYLSAIAFFVGLGIIDQFPVARQALLSVEMRELVGWVPLAWGVTGLLAVVAELAGVFFDSRLLTRAASYVYFALWVFAGMMYLTGGYFVLLVGIAIPHALFWAWNFAVRYEHNRIVDEVKRAFRWIT